MNLPCVPCDSLLLGVLIFSFHIPTLILFCYELIGEISGSHTDTYEYDCLLGCCVV
jgi:hypothetical protein